ncbi:hypothetical protein QWY84_05355 [Aquisalimonas lutea]|uniref:hypothetical protein n=1 Tax=Aquisalimonas lutea TaxID=1327750 RepID=UPI0025B452E4|nr:hypothetical protein [Aquisalimonas lutea]MDN3517030.1 hypothetical protein [Aquisalimonas lutea]
MIPLWLKLAYTAGAVGILVVYWFRYGPGNYLWFSDIALIVTIPALWLESALLASMMAVSVLLPEALWNLSFFGRLLTGRRISGLTEYMFEPQRPRYLRALSLFHVPLPIILAWMISVLGYDPRALALMTLLAWIVLPATYVLTPPSRNVNWVHGPGGEGTRQTRLHPLAYLGVLMVAFPVVVYLPTHLLLLVLFG